MEYYSAKKDILPYVTTQINLEYIMLSEISETKTRILWYHLHVESKKAKLVKIANFKKSWRLGGSGTTFFKC